MLERYRSKLEEDIGSQLESQGIPYAYEAEKIDYTVPARSAKYTPDFILTTKSGHKIYVEAKGVFGFDPKHQTARSSSAQARQKMILVKEQHPDLDIRFIFSKAKTPIYKGSPTTYAMWAESHGFLWAEKTLPQEWIEEITNG